MHWIVIEKLEKIIDDFFHMIYSPHEVKKCMNRRFLYLICLLHFGI